MLQRPLIAVCGPSGIGKTRACSLVRGATAIACDDYYLDEGDPRIPIVRGAPDWNSEQSLDWELLLQDLARLRAGEAIQVPMYDMARSKRVGWRAHRPLEQRAVLVEGIFSFALPEMRDMSRILLDCPAPRWLSRQIRRDVAEGRRPFLSAVRYTFSGYSRNRRALEQSRGLADLVVDARQPVAVVAALIDRFIAGRGAVA